MSSHLISNLVETYLQDRKRSELKETPTGCKSPHPRNRGSEAT